jgi:RTA1 like protein
VEYRIEPRLSSLFSLISLNTSFTMSNSSDDGPSWSVMGNSTCLDPNSPDAIWPYCPNEGAAIFFAILFLGTTVANIYFAAKYRLSFCWVLIMGAIWELVGFGMRAAATQYQQSMALYTPMLLLVLLAPLWINAFVYMLFARIVYYFDESQKVAFIPATRLGVLFICLDIVTFFIQAIGASMLSSTDASSINLGKTLYMSGIGFQEGFICLFLGFVIRFHLRARRSHTARSTHYNPTVILIYVSLALITVRIIFRLVEYSQGFDSPIPHTESYQYIFDALPMFIATLLWAIWHPGRVLVEKDGLFPTRQEKKQRKRERKEYKNIEKEQRKQRKAAHKLLGSGDATPMGAFSASPAGSPYLGPTHAPYDPYGTSAYYGAGLEEQGMLSPPKVPRYGRVE